MTQESGFGDPEDQITAEMLFEYLVNLNEGGLGRNAAVRRATAWAQELAVADKQTVKRFGYAGEMFAGIAEREVNKNP